MFRLFLVGLVGLLKTAKADATPSVDKEDMSPTAATDMGNIRARRTAL